MRITILLTAFVATLIGGCLSQIVTLDEHIKSWLGQPIEEKRNILSRPGSYASSIGWKEKTYRLDNGNWTYVAPVRPNCLIHWEVSPQGTIVGYKLEGCEGMR